MKNSGYTYPMNPAPDISQLSSIREWEPVLKSRLVHNRAAEVEIDPEGGLRISVPNLRPAWHRAPICWIVRIPKRKTLELDPLGRSFWELCTPNRTVEDVVDVFAEQYELSFHEARMLITRYAMQLVQRGALAVIPGSQEAE